MAKTKVESKPVTSLAKYDGRLAELAKRAKKAVSKVGSNANFISLQGGGMTYKGAVVPENRMKVIVVHSIPENQYYDPTKPYDPDSFEPPLCYAFGKDPDPALMAPNPDDVLRVISASGFCTKHHDDSGDLVEGCDMNEWGSAEVGKGKGCKEVARLALLTEGDLEDNIEDGEIAYLKVPVTSMKYWAGLVRQFTDVYNRPSLAFVIEIFIVKDDPRVLPGWHLDFKLVEQIEDPEVFEALFKRFDVVTNEIAFPYPKESSNGSSGAAVGKQRTPRNAVQRVQPPKPQRGAAAAAPTKKGRATAAAAVAEAPAAVAAGGSGIKLGLRKPVKKDKF